MTEVANLSFSVDSAQLERGVSALDQMAAASSRAGSSVDQSQTSLDALTAAITRNTAATTQLTASLTQVGNVGTRTQTTLTGVGAAAAGAAANVNRMDGANKAAVGGLNATADTARRAKDAWAELGKQGADTAFKLDVARKMSQAPAANGNMPGAPRQISEASRNQTLTNIGFQAQDFVSQVLSGGSPIRAAMIQAPQAYAIASAGGLGVGDIGKSIADKLTSVGTGAVNLVSKIGLVDTAMGGLATAALAAVVAQQSYASSQRELTRQLSGVGRASGLTVSQVNALAPDAASAGGLSVSQASQLIGGFGATGRIGGSVASDLTSTVKVFSLMTGQDVESAGQDLAKAFADPAKGAEELNKQLGFLDATTLESIKSLQAQGDRLGAQRVLLEAYKSSLVDASTLTSGWSKAFGALGRAASDAFTAVGKGVDQVLTGGDLETQLATAQKVLEASKARESYLPFGIGSRDTALAQGDVDKLKAERDKLKADADKRDRAQRSLDVNNLVQGYNPQTEQLKKITQDAENIRKNLREGVLDPDGSSARTAAGLEASAKRIREDLVQGGTQFANALRAAQFEQRTVGFTQPASQVAGINERAENEIKNLQTSPNDPLLRDYQINSIRERQKVELETARRQSTLSENALGGAFSRMTPEVQAQLQSGSNRFGRVPVGVLAAIANIESGGNLDVGYTKSLDENGKQGTAYGLGQITRTTGNELQRRYGIDRMNRSTMGDALAGVLDMKLDATGGDLTKAIMAYRGSSKPGVNEAYAAKVLRDAGQMGDASQLGQVKDQDQRVRALDDEKEKLAIVNKYLGENAEKLDASTRAQQILSEAQARGIPITDSVRAEAERLASGMASVASSLAGTKAGRELDFQDAQLGRDRYDQQAYAQARSTFGDTNNTAFIDRTRTVSQLGDVKSTITDVSTSFVQALSRGTSAAQAFGQALTSIGNKLISGAVDSLVSSAFKGVGSGGGLLGGLGSLFSFASGGVMTGRGPVPLRTYASGGVASSPQLALFGEGSGPEAYVPLPDGKRIPVAMTGPAGGAANSNGSGDVHMHSWDLRGSNLTDAQVDSKINKAFQGYEGERTRTQFSKQALDKKKFG